MCFEKPSTFRTGVRKSLRDASRKFRHYSGSLSEGWGSENYARRHLAGGVGPERLIQTIAHFRHDKDNPEYYSRQTVTRAYASVALGRGDNLAEVQQRVAELSTHQRNPESNARRTISEMKTSGFLRARAGVPWPLGK